MITPDSLDIKHQRLFSLLRVALWHKAPDEKLFSGMTEEDWSKLIQTSVHHGVLAVAYDGMLLLPPELYPPRKIKLSWAVNVDALEKRYHHQVEVAKEIGVLFKNNGIDMLLFKGIGLAQMYPIPEHREFGDIDIYLFGKMKEGNTVLIKNNAKRNYNTGNHDVLIYKGISIENHCHFSGDRNFPEVQVLENRLLEIVSESEKKIFPGFPDTEILFPPADFNAIFLIAHALRHFITSSLNIRFLCDWTCFLHANRGNVDISRHREILSKSGLLSAADAFTSLCIQLLDFSPDEAPPYESNPMVESKMLADTLYPLQFSGKKHIWKHISYKIKRLKGNKWKFDLIYPGKYYMHVLNSIYHHIIHPSSILR